MDNLLQILLAEFHSKLTETDNSVERLAEFPDVRDRLKVAIGMRRVGKTYFLMQKIRQLVAEKVPLTRILYLNLEDDRLVPFAQKTLRDLIESFYALYPENHDFECYIFLDEIQNIQGWPLLIRRIFDTKKVQIFLSGSSSKLLSKEIHTSLRGRALAIEIWPYSFSEYLNATDIQLSGQLLGKRNTDLLLQHLNIYLRHGGFPEVINTTDSARREILQEYVDIVLMRDIIERHGITNVSLIKYMVKSLLKNVGSGFSVHRFFNDLQSQGIAAAKNTLYNYLAYIEDAYLSFSIPLYSESIRKVHTNPKKIYAVDPGLVKAYSFSLNENLGHLFENLVYLDLRRQGHKIFYYLTKERYEVDFFTFDKLGKPKLYQVVWDDSNKATMDRESRALKAAENELKVIGEVITPDSYVKKIGEERLRMQVLSR